MRKFGDHILKEVSVVQAFQVWGSLVMLDVFKGITWRAVDPEGRASRR